MPSCYDCKFYWAEHNTCLAWKTSPATARKYPHLCGSHGLTFSPIIMIRRPPPKKDEMYKPDEPVKFDY